MRGSGTEVCLLHKKSLVTSVLITQNWRIIVFVSVHSSEFPVHLNGDFDWLAVMPIS